jgi:hypothetical protein
MANATRINERIAGLKALLGFHGTLDLHLHGDFSRDQRPRKSARARSVKLDPTIEVKDFHIRITLYL